MQLPFPEKPCPTAPAILNSLTLNPLPVMLLVAGVEGAGHHALETVWEALSHEYDVVLISYDAHLHGIQGVPTASRGYHHAVSSLTDVSELKSELLVHYKHNFDNIDLVDWLYCLYLTFGWY